MIIFHAMRDFAQGLVRGIGLFFSERDPQNISRLFPDERRPRR